MDWNLIVQIRSSTLTECLRYSRIPIPDAAQICILEDPGAPPGQAERLYRHLTAAIGSLGTAADPPNWCGGPQGLHCVARDEPNCISVLVVIAGNGAVSSSVSREMNCWKRNGPATDVVLPILPAGSSVLTVLGPQHKTITALFCPGDITAIGDAVLQAAGIGGIHRRLFISYRRDETRELADQLFDAFSRERFDVYLDRYSGVPGRLFPDQIGEELVDKGVVLLLESAGVASSPWTQAELGFAFLFGLGIVAVNVDGAPESGLISARTSVTLAANKTVDAVRLLQIVDFVRAAYPHEGLKRRLFLSYLLRLSLAPHRLVAQPRGQNAFEVESASIGATRKRYLVSLAERAPDVTDVRRAMIAAGRTAQPVVLGAHLFLPPTSKRDLRWLQSELRFGLMGEGEMIRKAAAIARGEELQ